MFQISLSRRATIDTIMPTLLLHASAQGGYDLGQALNPIGEDISCGEQRRGPAWRWAWRSWGKDRAA